MYIELLCEVTTLDGTKQRGELIGSHYAPGYGYQGVVRVDQDHEVLLYTPERITILDTPLPSDTFARDLVSLLISKGAKQRT